MRQTVGNMRCTKTNPFALASCVAAVLIVTQLAASKGLNPDSVSFRLGQLRGANS